MKEPLSLEYAIHKNADRLVMKSEQYREIDNDRAMPSRVMSTPQKAFRPKQCIHQVNERNAATIPAIAYSIENSKGAQTPW
jgi:hypothetical protein